MQLTAKVDAFVKEVAASMGSVGTGSTPVAGLLSLSSKDGNLIITATNLDFGIRTKVAATVATDGSFLVDAARLNSWLSTLPVEDKDIAIKQNPTRTTFSVGRSRSVIAQSDPANFPVFPKPTDQICRMASGALKDLLSGILPVIEDFESPHYNYSGAQLVFGDGNITAMATNGNRLAYSTLPGEVLKKFTSLITRKAIAELIRVASKTNTQVAIAASENNVFFNFGNRLMYCRRLRDNFPDCSRVLPKIEKQFTAVVNSAEAIQTIRRVATLSETSKRIVIEFSEGQANISSASSLGESDDGIAVAYGGPKHSVGVNFSWLIDALRVVGEEAVIAFTENEAHPIEVRPKDGLHYRNIMGRCVGGKE